MTDKIRKFVDVSLSASLIMGFMTNSMQAQNQLISHDTHSSISIDIKALEAKLSQQQTLALPLEQELDLLRQLTEFELGRFLLQNKGLNGYWTSYAIRQGLNKTNLSHLEEWILHSSPVVKATRERFHIFQKYLHENLKDNTTIASIPCGIMDDLSQLTTKSLKDITFVGIDYDDECLALAKQNYISQQNVSVDFRRSDAWALKSHSEFDIITSNGLNIYEHDHVRVTDLYKVFYTALKPGGILITSFLTPPPTVSAESSWKNFNVFDLTKQKALFVDIIGVNWQAFRTETQTREQLELAGFKDITFIYDSQGMFPTVIAKKS